MLSKEEGLRHRKVISANYKRTEISYPEFLTDLQQHHPSCLSLESSIG